MGEHTAESRRERGHAVFTDPKYSVRYEMAFDGGVTVPASVNVPVLVKGSFAHASPTSI